MFIYTKSAAATLSKEYTQTKVIYRDMKTTTNRFFVRLSTVFDFNLQAEMKNYNSTGTDFMPMKSSTGWQRLLFSPL